MAIRYSSFSRVMLSFDSYCPLVCLSFSVGLRRCFYLCLPPCLSFSFVSLFTYSFVLVLCRLCPFLLLSCVPRDAIPAFLLRPVCDFVSNSMVLVVCTQFQGSLHVYIHVHMIFDEWDYRAQSDGHFQRFLHSLPFSPLCLCASLPPCYMPPLLQMPRRRVRRQIRHRVRRRVRRLARSRLSILQPLACSAQTELVGRKAGNQPYIFHGRSSAKTLQINGSLSCRQSPPSKNTQKV